MHCSTSPHDVAGEGLPSFRAGFGPTEKSNNNHPVPPCTVVNSNSDLLALATTTTTLLCYVATPADVASGLNLRTFTVETEEGASSSPAPPACSMRIPEGKGKSKG